MSTKTTAFEESFPNEPTNLGEEISDTAAQVKDKVSDMGRTAADKIDENRHAAADGIEKAAAALHEKAGNLPGGEKVTELAHATAEKLTSTADYVRKNDVNSMMADVEELVKKNPGPSLVAAAVIGFLVGRAFSSND